MEWHTSGRVVKDADREAIARQGLHGCWRDYVFGKELQIFVTTYDKIGQLSREKRKLRKFVLNKICH